ncbi:trehalose-phosphatase [Puia sp. P3]|uniref:trehalose-phosphatase n=1 Tax=Puia sp. P3 TaxID=3423952 RepID=UPI003D66E1B0
MEGRKGRSAEFEIKFLDNVTKVELLNKYSNAARRIILLDYDGTLVPFSKLPSTAIPGAEMLETLSKIADNPLNEVFIVSGRDSQTLEKWFSQIPVGLIAEHGAKNSKKSGEWVTESTALAEDWKQKIEKIMAEYVNKCPHSFIEKRNSPLPGIIGMPTLGDGIIRAKELCDDLSKFASHHSLNILNGNKVIEVRAKGVNKGKAISHILNGNDYDFILCIGDDQTDEDMFRKLATRPEAFTIKVGNEASFAKYNLYNPYMVQSLLHTLSLYAPGNILS